MAKPSKGFRNYIHGASQRARVNNILSKPKVDLKKRKPLLRETLVDKMKAETLLNHFKVKYGEKVNLLEQGQNLSIKELLKTDMNFSKLMPGDDDMDLYEKSDTFEEPTRIGNEMGSLYKQLIRLTIGAKQDEQMRTARDLYKGQTWPAFNSQSSKYGTATYMAIYSTAGANRQGVWYPRNINASAGAWTTESLLRYAGYISPILLKVQMYKEIRDNLLSSDIFTWLGQEENMSSDVFYGINSITDTITFANSMTFLPVELKVYLCQAKTRTKFPPASDWFIPTGEAQASYNIMNSSYVYNSPTVTTEDPATGLQNTIFTESSVHLGATPFYSPTFRDNWKVVDVINKTIEPTDKFELTLHREFRHAHSIREMEAAFDSMENKGWYQESDYAMVITFRGKPCFLKWNGEQPEEVSLDTREVDASPAKILMTSRSSFNISAPNLFTTANVRSRDNNPNYIAGEGRVLDTSLETFTFETSTDSTGWQPNIVTNLAEQAGGAR